MRPRNNYFRPTSTKGCHREGCMTNCTGLKTIAYHQKPNPVENIYPETQVRWPEKKARVRPDAGRSLPVRSGGHLFVLTFFPMGCLWRGYFFVSGQKSTNQKLNTYQKIERLLGFLGFLQLFDFQKQTKGIYNCRTSKTARPFLYNDKIVHRTLRIITLSSASQ